MRIAKLDATRTEAVFCPSKNLGLSRIMIQLSAGKDMDLAFTVVRPEQSRAKAAKQFGPNIQPLSPARIRYMEYGERPADPFFFLRGAKALLKGAVPSR